MTSVPSELPAARERFLELVRDIRPELFRYCSRLVGSAIDGEDVVQEALAKAYYALSLSPELPPLRPWLIRIAHNTAIDFLRRYERRFVEPTAQMDEVLARDETPPQDVVRIALSRFVGLPVLQRSAVILKDVLGFELEEIVRTTGATLPAVKAALGRGRAALRDFARAEAVPWRDRPETSSEERRILRAYAARFNARDWAAIEELLADECRLDLVSKAERRGKKQVRGYFGQYAKENVCVIHGYAEGREVLGVMDRTGRARAPARDAIRAVPDAAAAGSVDVAYVIALEIGDGLVNTIRDWRYVPYLSTELRFEPGDDR